MGKSDRLGDKAQEMKGRAKESVGAMTDDERLRAEGRLEQEEAEARQKLDKVVEAGKDATTEGPRSGGVR